MKTTITTAPQITTAEALDALQTLTAYAVQAIATASRYTFSAVINAIRWLAHRHDLSNEEGAITLYGWQLVGISSAVCIVAALISCIG